MQGLLFVWIFGFVCLGCFVLVALLLDLVGCMGALLVTNVLCVCWWLRFWMFSVTGITDGWCDCWLLIDWLVGFAFGC